MDGQHFDNLTRRLAATRSRRSVLKLLAGGVAGSALALVGGGAAEATCREAGRRCSAHGNCCSGICDPASMTCACPPGTENCRGACTAVGDYQADLANCGGCGNGCPVVANATGSCNAGSCGFACNPGFGLCGGGCVSTGGCCIDGVAVAAGATNPGNSCQECQLGTSATAWSNRADGASCNDGNACTRTDACQAGQCAGGNPVVCPAPDQCHDAGVCDPTNGACTYLNKAEGTLCNDGNPCTLGDSCQGGVCVSGHTAACTATNDCLSGQCNPATGRCEFGPRPAGTPCHTNPANPCIVDTTCDAEGTCVGGTPLACPPCHVCHPSGPIIAECVPIDCAPGQCHETGVCDQETGACTYQNKAYGTRCEDGNLCTFSDTCQDGICVAGTPIGCVATNPCLSGQCNPATGECEYGPRPAGTPCNDGNACTSNTTCNSAGNCGGGTPHDCPGLCQVCASNLGQPTCVPAPIGTECYRSCTEVGTCTASGSCQINQGGGCLNVAECDDFVCDEASGQCVHSGAKDGQPCGTGSCLRCQAGQCGPGSCTCGAHADCSGNADCCNSSCCPAGQGCCTRGDGLPGCRPRNQLCNAGCYDEPVTACGDRCIADDRVCCPGGARSCPVGEACCGLGVCCPPGVLCGPFGFCGV